MRQAIGKALLNALSFVPPGVLALFASARADYVQHFWETRQEPKGIVRVSDALSYFSTSSNYDLEGNPVSPSGLNNYSRIENNLNLVYGLAPGWSAFGTLAWARVELDSTRRPGNTFGFTDQLAGIGFRAYGAETGGLAEPGDRGFLRSVDLQAQISFPLYDNAASDADLTPHLGDQSIDLTAGAFASVRLARGQRSDFLLTGGAGYTRRSGGFSSALPWSISFQYLPAQAAQSGFQASLAALGSLSLQTDLPGADASAGQEESFYTGVINPSLTTLRAQGAYALNHDLLLSVTCAQAVWGRSAPHGFSLALGLQKTFGAAGPGKSRLKMTGEEYGRANRGFIEYTFSAKVLRVNDRLNLVKIDKGSQDGVEVGAVFDIFIVKPDGSAGEPVARAKTTAVKLDEAALTVTEYFKQVWIEEGFIAKRPLQ